MASICHWGEPYQTESEPNTIRSGPMNFISCPIRCAATVGKVTIEEAHVVPSSAYVFLYGRTRSAYSVVHLMSGTPSRSLPDFTSCKASYMKNAGWMQAWYVMKLRFGQAFAAFGRSAGCPISGRTGSALLRPL